MSTPQDQPTTPEPVPAPTVSTAPTGGTTPPIEPTLRWWHWGAIPDHLGRARTSTVVLSVLFVAVFILYLAVRPEPARTGTAPAGGGSDVEAPANPVVPSETTTPVPTSEPTGTTGPQETEAPEDGTETPTTTPAPTTTSPRSTQSPTEPGNSPTTTTPSGQPDGTVGGTPDGTTDGTTGGTDDGTDRSAPTPATTATP